MKTGLPLKYLRVYYLNCLSLTTIHFTRAAWAFSKYYLKSLDGETFSLSFFAFCDFAFLIVMTLMIQLTTKVPLMRAGLKPLILIGLSANFLCFLGMPLLSFYEIGDANIYFALVVVMGLFQAVVVPSGIMILNGMKIEKVTDYTWMFIFQNVGHILGFAVCLIAVEISGGSLAVVSFFGCALFFFNIGYAGFALFGVDYNREPCYEECVSEEGRKVLRNLNTLNIQKKPPGQKNFSSSYDSIMENYSDRSQRLELSQINQGLKRQNSAPNRTNKQSSNGTGLNKIKKC